MEEWKDERKGHSLPITTHFIRSHPPLKIDREEAVGWMDWWWDNEWRERDSEGSGRSLWSLPHGQVLPQSLHSISWPLEQRRDDGERRGKRDGKGAQGLIVRPLASFPIPYPNLWSLHVGEAMGCHTLHSLYHLTHFPAAFARGNLSMGEHTWWRAALSFLYSFPFSVCPFPIIHLLII